MREWMCVCVCGVCVCVCVCVYSYTKLIDALYEYSLGMTDYDRYVISVNGRVCVACCSTVQSCTYVHCADEIRNLTWPHVYNTCVYVTCTYTHTHTWLRAQVHFWKTCTLQLWLLQLHNLKGKWRLEKNIVPPLTSLVLWPASSALDHYIPKTHKISPKWLACSVVLVTHRRGNTLIKVDNTTNHKLPGTQWWRYKVWTLHTTLQC